MKDDRMDVGRAPLNIILGPAGSSGDVHPMVGIGKALKQRGHAVTVATNPHFGELIQRAGLDFEPVGTAQGYHDALRDPGMWQGTRGFSTVLRYVAPMVREGYEVTRRLCRREPTVMVGQMLGLGMRIAREKLNVPMASTHLQPACFASSHQPAETVFPIPDWSPVWMNRIFTRLLEAVTDRQLAPVVNPILEELDLPAARRIITDWVHSPDRVIGMFPDWYAPQQPDWPPQTILTGFPLYDEDDVVEFPAEVDEFIESGEPPLVFTPGSANIHGEAFFVAAADACERLGRNGILLTRYPDQLPTDLPSRVRHFDYVPFGRLLPRCAALICHGGIGSVAQGLKAGIPQLVMPLSFDQPDNAARLRRLGVGASLKPRRFTGARVARVLGDLLASEEVARACAAAADRMRQGNPVQETCDAIEALAEGWRY